MSFKVRLLLGAAAPIMLAFPAAAQVSITTATTTPVATSNNGSPANIDITTAGSVTLTNQPNTSAVTINTNNNVTNAGSINTNNSDNSTGLRIGTNLNANYSGAGAITATEDYVRTDTDNDGDLDGPVAQGTGRFGLLVDPGGTLNGNINLLSGSGVTVEGNNSAGVSIQSVLNGNYKQKGAVIVNGANGVGLEFRQDVTGNVGIGGSVVGSGQNSAAARVLGNVAGEFMVDGTIIATGFTATDVDNFDDPAVPDDTPLAGRFDPDDLLTGGVGLEIRGSLARGLLVQGDAVGGVDPTPDVKDVTQNFNVDRTSGSISSVGSAAALLLQPLDGAAGTNIHLGLVRETVTDQLDDDKDGDISEVLATFNYDFGFMNRGSIIGNGLNTGFSALAARIAGSADGTHTVTIDGGIFNSGTITAAGYEGNSTGLSIGAGVSTPQILNNGTISASVATTGANTATAVKIDAGATIPSVVNNTLIAAGSRGLNGNATAFQDLSGSVTSFRNNSRVSALIGDLDTTDTVTTGSGRAIALDLSHGSSAVTLTQTDAIDNARIFGDVLLGAGSDRFDLLSGAVVGNVDFGTAGSDTFQINSAALTGNAAFHGSNVNFSMVGSQMAGALSLGNAAGTLSFTGSSIYNGDITGTGAISMLVDNSTVNNSADGTLSLSTMNLTNNAKIGFVIDNARIASNTPIFNITGAANIAANTVFTPIFQEFSNQAFTLRVLNAATLNLGGPVDAMLSASSPYLYNVSLVRPTGLNALDLVLRVKTIDELGLNTRQGSAYDGVLDLMEQNATVGAAVTSLPGKNEFLRGWNDLLPASDATIMRVLASNATAAFGATAHRLDLISDKPDAPGGAWTEEYGVYHQSDATNEGLAVTGGGFGVSGGVDLLASRDHLIGAFAALESVELEEEDRTSAPLNVSQATFGAYAGWKNGNLALNGAAGIGLVKFSSNREVQVGTLTDKIKGEWDGLTYNAAARASYNLPLGFLDVRPYVAADYQKFQQDGYTENAETLDALAIVAGDNDSTLSTASYGLQLIGNFGSDRAFSIKPQLSVGYRSILSWDDAGAPLRFTGGSAGSSFKLDPGAKPEDAIVAGLGFNIDSQFLNIHVGYDAEIADTYTTHYGSVTLRMAFW